MDYKKSFPVKYMVITAEDGFSIIDTSCDVEEDRIVVFSMHFDRADTICKFLNEAEGFTYLTHAERNNAAI